MSLVIWFTHFRVFLKTLFNFSFFKTLFSKLFLISQLYDFSSSLVRLGIYCCVMFLNHMTSAVLKEPTGHVNTNRARSLAGVNRVKLTHLTQPIKFFSPFSIFAKFFDRHFSWELSRFYWEVNFYGLWPWSYMIIRYVAYIWHLGAPGHYFTVTFLPGKSAKINFSINFTSIFKIIVPFWWNCVYQVFTGQMSNF